MSDSSRRADQWLVLGVGLVVRLAVVAWAWGRIPPSADGVYYHALASRIAQGQGYTWLWPDGVVTHAAHYPVGYPALVAAPYALFGAVPGTAMLLNAFIGALGCVAVQRLLLHHRDRRTALIGGLLVALHPGLVGYTPALMTEGVTGALIACAALAVSAARRAAGKRRLLLAVAGGVVLGLATLLRPQCVLLAPLFGALVWRRRLRDHGLGALLICGVVLLVCAPWTLRNCSRMGRCALVSVNGGWNLLIGTDPAGKGGFEPLKVPLECREVFDEAGKDRCFAASARRRIRADPGAWIALAPRKVALTLDYCGAAGSYLHAANQDAFGTKSEQRLGAVEIVYERLLLLFALLACWPEAARRRRWPRRLRIALLVAGVIAAASVHGSVAFAVLLVLITWRRPGLLRSAPSYAAAFGVVLCVAGVHAVFFGAGRYQLLIWPVMCALAAIGLGRIGRTLSSLRRDLRVS